MASEQKTDKYGEKIGYQFDCDVNWVTLMNNRLFLREVADTIIGETKSPVRLGGACIIGDRSDDLRLLIDEQTLDLVTPNLRQQINTNSDEQSLYTTLNNYITRHSPQRGMCNLYFVGDAHGQGEHIDIHWNCCVVDMRPGCEALVWYDPSSSLSGGGSYNFSNIKQYKLIQALRKHIPKSYVSIELQPAERAQQFCGKHPAQDIFCQTWVIMFASAYINNVFDLYATIDFIMWQNEPLKMWARCIVSRMRKGRNSWQNEVNRNYKPFITYCRRYIPGQGTNVYRLPRIVSSTKRGQKKQPCIFSAISHYLNMPIKKVQEYSKKYGCQVKEQFTVDISTKQPQATREPYRLRSRR